METQRDPALSLRERLGNKPVARGLAGVYVCLGIACVGIGVVNIFIPGLPSTVFFIMALWAFERSSPRLERALLANRFIGPTLRDWRETGSLTRRTKIVSIAMIWVFIGISAWLIESTWVRALLLAVAVSLTVFLSSRPTAAERPRRARGPGAR